MPLIYFPAPPRLGLRSPASLASCTGVRHSPPPRSPCFQLPQFLTKGFHQILLPTPCSPALYPRNQGRSRRSQHGARGGSQETWDWCGLCPLWGFDDQGQVTAWVGSHGWFPETDSPKGLVTTSEATYCVKK